MGTFPNKATQFTAGAHQVEMARKAGKVSGPQFKYAAKLREMKKKLQNGKVTNKEMEWFIACATDPDANLLKLEQDCDMLLKITTKPSDIATVIGLKNTIHKLKFGEKRINLNMNVNVDVDVDEVTEHLGKLIDMKKD